MKALMAGLVLIAASAVAQEAVPVKIVATSKDSTGSRLVLSMREQVARSSIFREPRGAEPYVVLRIVTQDPDDGLSSAGSRTIYAITLTMTAQKLDKETYVTTFVGNCGSKVIADCADTILARMLESK